MATQFLTLRDPDANISLSVTCPRGMPLGPGRRRALFALAFWTAGRVFVVFERVLSVVAILLPPNHWVLSWV